VLTLNLALAGLAIGAIAALSGLGLLVTYRTTGVLDLAHGAFAMMTAYLLWQAVRGWGWPLQIAAPLAIFVVGPGLGLLADLMVFRPLRHRGAGPSESLVASLGVLVLLMGVAFQVWGGQAHLDAPSIFPSGAIKLPGGATVLTSTVEILGVLVVIGLAGWLLSQYTRIGLYVRAVVDRRELAELSGVNADGVAAIGWGVGGGLAGLTGVLLAPSVQLTPFGLTLIVLETLAVVVIAKLKSPTVCVLAALALGIAQSELQQVQFSDPDAQQALGALQSNLFVVALLVGLLLRPRLAEVGETGTPALLAPSPRGGSHRLWILFGALALLAPLTFQPEDLRAAEVVPALALIFLSLVLLTGISGQISLGQAGYAGMGALFSVMLVQGRLGIPALPAGTALAVGALLAGVAGLVTGFAAVRRTGLALALTTFAVGTVATRFLFEQPAVVDGLHVLRLFPGHKTFYLAELVLLTVGLGALWMLSTGVAGRALRAMRDSEDGARSVGIDIRALKLLTFTVSAAMAGLGGALLAQASGSFDADAFSPLQGLVWFAVVLVAGAESTTAAVGAAALLVFIDYREGPGTSTFVVGLLAVLLGRMPGGVAGMLRRWPAYAAGPVPAASLASPWRPRETLPGPDVTPTRPLRLSPRGRELLMRVRR